MSLNEKDLYFSYVNEDGKRVSGTASLNHHIKKVGGINEYNKRVGRAFLERFMDVYADSIIDDLLTQEEREYLRVVK